ncbi:vitamin K epoxide reductase family protein [Candidatus Parcubacteria bacterium]|nr:MAG: vitamin K epoxide reductase family protein [Candidatus Parcubacteria bacterium]
MTYYISILILSIVGAVNASYLYWQYRQKIKNQRPMTCLFGQDCEAVVGSQWGKTLGVKNEIVGTLFYLALISLSAWQLSGSDFPKIPEAVLFIAIIAAIASSYLLVIQFSVLKNFCSWCIFSAVINYLILFTSIFLFVK